MTVVVSTWCRQTWSHGVFINNAARRRQISCYCQRKTHSMYSLCCMWP